MTRKAKTKTKVSFWELDPMAIFLISFLFIWGAMQIIGFVIIELTR